MTVATNVPALHVGSPTMIGPLTVFPIWTDAPLRQRDYHTTLPAGAVVAELEDGPRVPELRISNPGPDAILMPDGLLLDGGWQHRVLVGSSLVTAAAEGRLPVACVESGRWGGQTGQGVARRIAPVAVRGATNAALPDQPGRRPRRHLDQAEVWRRVESLQQRAAIRSDTSSLVDAQQQVDGPARRLLRGTGPLPAQRGVLVGAAGHPVLLELFDHPTSLRRFWRPILTSVLVDAMPQPAVLTKGHRAREFARRLAASPLSLGEHAGAARRVSPQTTICSPPRASPPATFSTFQR